MRTIRCGRGLGDSLYLQSVVRHLVGKGQRWRVRSDFPDVFRPLIPQVSVTPFSRKVEVLAHYSTRKGVAGTTQFEDCCIAAGIKESVDLRLDWKVTNQRLTDRVLELGRPVLMVQLPRSPMGRTDGFGAELLPNCSVIQRLIDQARETHTVVQVGAGAALFNFKGIDLDLANRTTVAEMIDVSAVADRFLGYVSFLVPLAESLSRPAMFVWSRAGLDTRQHLYVRQITPQKVLHKPSSRFVIDDWTPGKIDEVANEFLR